MSQKMDDLMPRNCCERYSKHLCAFSVKSNNRIVPSVPRYSAIDTAICKNKSKSTGLISKHIIAKPKKTSKSDVLCYNNLLNNDFNCVEKCGDAIAKNYIPKNGKPKIKTVQKSIQQYYKNENFERSAQSLLECGCEKTHSLNTIKEQSEKHSDGDILYKQSCTSSSSLYSEDSIIENIKEFRKRNYFECHSTKSRIKTKGSVTSLNNHKCVYRFYLNDRLFPVPVSKDYNNNIRCVECQLPLDTESEHINGTIQAKVKLNNKIQDMMLILPITQTLILNEKRKLNENKQLESLYFGIIKLNLNGDSIFNRNVPSDSYALKYQKGYKEYVNVEKYEYDNTDKNIDIII